MNNLKIQENGRISGRVKIDTYRPGMVAVATPLLEEFKIARALPEGTERTHRLAIIKDALARVKESYFIRTAAEVHNLIMDSPGFGLDLIIQRLVGVNTYSLNILWLELGTGTTAPTVNDTGLTSPTVRLPVSYLEDFGATDAIVQAYVSDGNLPNDTYGEVGSFVDGTSTTGTGQIFNHALISPTYSKVGGQDTTIEIDFTIINS